jgi:hypothetical protein
MTDQQASPEFDRKNPVARFEELPDKEKKDLMLQPLSERLKPSSPIHSKLISELQEMIRASQSHIEQRYMDWDRVDEACRLYMDTDRKKIYSDKSQDSKLKQMPFKDSIKLPIIYSTLVTRVAVLWNQLTSRYPRIHLEGRGSEDLEGARIHEAQIQYDLEQSDFDLRIWQAIFDVEKYGLAVMYDTWEEKYGYVPRKGINPLENILRDQANPGVPQDDREFELVKEWNNIANIDPREFRPDPNVPVSQIQNMNFVGHKDHQNYLWYKERQLKDRRGPFFNIDAARNMMQGGQNYRNVDGRSSEGTYLDYSRTEYPNFPVVHLQWKIIPRQWGLSQNDNPEIWWFSILDNESAQIIIRAHRSVYAHGEFTYSVAQSDLDQHAPFVPGMGQQLIGIQDTADWLTNSHIVQAKKLINDQVIFNDDLINPVDIKHPGPAKHIRLTKRGKRLQELGQLKISDMYGQFVVADVTKQHLETVQFLWPQAQRMAATPDTLQGMPLPTKRTLGEVESVNQSATMRLGQTAVLLDKQLIGPIARRMVANRQQFPSMDITVRIAGRLVDQLAKLSGGATQIEISPNDLAGNYDYIPHTPTMAPDPARQGAVWLQILQILASAPQLMNPDPNTGEAIDPHAVFEEAVRASGINYFDRFKKTMEPMPGQAGPGQMPPDQPAAGGVATPNSADQTTQSVRSGNAV